MCLGVLICLMMEWFKKQFTGGTFAWLVKADSPLRYGRWLGWFERIGFFIALCVKMPEAIAMWLTFKLAAKWDAWNSIVKVPDTLREEEEREYLIFRRRWGEHRLMTFLIGTLANIVAAACAYIIARYAFTEF
jgi:hypothetical protein